MCSSGVRRAKKRPMGALLLGGRERIRTAVQGFADLCLATRPLDQSELECKCRDYSKVSKTPTLIFVQKNKNTVRLWFFL